MDRPTSSEVRQELDRVKHGRTYRKTLKSTIYILVTVAAFAVLVATLWMPVLEVYGGSMEPTLQEGELVAAVKSGDFKTGDVVAFYYNNKILVKRVIAGPGDWVDVSKDGTVTVNGTVLDEPYVDELAYGDTNIDLPYQVPDGRWFVMGGPSQCLRGFPEQSRGSRGRRTGRGKTCLHHMASQSAGKRGIGR